MRGRQGGVVLHGKVEVQGPPLPGLQDPLPVKPVLGVLRVAVEPQPAPRHAAPGDGLLHEAPGHQGRLVQQHPRQGAALDQRRAGLVPSAEEQEAVLMAPQPHSQQVLRPPFPAVEAQPPQIGHQLRQQVPPQGGDGLAAQPQLPPVKASHRPQEEGQPHGKGLAAADGPVADDGLPVPGAAPPGQHLPLLGRKPHDLSRRPTLLPPRRRPPAPGTAPRRPPPFPRSAGRTGPPGPGCGR